MITKSTIQCTNNTITVSRLINNKLQCIEFNNDVLARDICDYFNMKDDLFLKLVVRKELI